MGAINLVIIQRSYLDKFRQSYRPSNYRYISLKTISKVQRTGRTFKYSNTIRLQMYLIFNPSNVFLYSNS